MASERTPPIRIDLTPSQHPLRGLLLQELIPTGAPAFNPSPVTATPAPTAAATTQPVFSPSQQPPPQPQQQPPSAPAPTTPAAAAGSRSVEAMSTRGKESGAMNGHDDALVCSCVVLTLIHIERFFVSVSVG